MSLEELWELFPISLIEPSEKWTQQYEGMKTMLTKVLEGTAGLRVSHIGSTAISGIKSKDIVDVLVEVAPEESLPAIAKSLESLGFIIMSESFSEPLFASSELPQRISMNFGYTMKGYAEEVFHVHLRHKGDNDELYFRDYLNDNPDIAREYEVLKLDLCAKCNHDRDAYTKGKADFVRVWSKAARRAYDGRY